MSEDRESWWQQRYDALEAKVQALQAELERRTAWSNEQIALRDAKLDVLEARVPKLEAERDRLVDEVGAINNSWHAPRGLRAYDVYDSSDGVCRHCRVHGGGNCTLCWWDKP